jgi:hypothetical protein
MRRHLAHIFALVGLIGLIAMTHGSVTATAPLPPPPGSIDTIAGGGTLTGEGIPATDASFFRLEGVAVNSVGDVFVSDRTCTVKKISGGTLTTAVGGGCQPYTSNDLGDGGPAILARLGINVQLAFDAQDNLYIADTWDCAIRKVDARSGTITTIAGSGPLLCDDTVRYPLAVAAGPDGSVYFSEPDACVVRKITDGIITTFAGTGPPPGGGRCAFGGDGGPATSASLNPYGIAVDPSGNVYIADEANCRVREVSAGIITTVTGTGQCYFSPDGPATSAAVDPFGGLAIGSAGDLYIADAVHCLVRKLHDGNIITVAGSLVFPIPEVPDVYTSLCGFGGDGGPATQALLDGPIGVAADALGNVYILDLLNFRVRIVYGATPPATSHNVSPVLSVPGAQSVTVGGSLAFTVAATDANADPLVLSAFGLPAGLTLVDNHDGTGSVSGTAAVAPGTYHAEFWASDGTIPATARTVDIVVTPPGSPPTLVVPSSVSVQYSEPLSFNITATDPDSDPITLGAAGLPAGLSFVDHGDGTGAVYGIVSAPVGIYTATFSAKDIWNAPTLRSVTIVVYNRAASESGTGWVLDGGNRADFSFNAQYGKKDQVQGQLQYTYHPGNQTIKLKSTGLQWLVAVGNVAVLRGTATLNGAPGYVFELTVTDNGAGATDTLALSIWSADGSVQHVEPASVLGGGSVIVRTH